MQAEMSGDERGFNSVRLKLLVVSLITTTPASCELQLRTRRLWSPISQLKRPASTSKRKRQYNHSHNGTSLPCAHDQPPSTSPYRLTICAAPILAPANTPLSLPLAHPRPLTTHHPLAPRPHAHPLQSLQEAQQPPSVARRPQTARTKSQMPARRARAPQAQEAAARRC